jgi:hypothetical protein
MDGLSGSIPCPGEGCTPPPWPTYRNAVAPVAGGYPTRHASLAPALAVSGRLAQNSRVELVHDGIAIH